MCDLLHAVYPARNVPMANAVRHFTSTATLRFRTKGGTAGWRAGLTVVSWPTGFVARRQQHKARLMRPTKFVSCIQTAIKPHCVSGILSACAASSTSPVEFPYSSSPTYALQYPDLIVQCDKSPLMSDALTWSSTCKWSFKKGHCYDTAFNG